jgi:hypothetical protein
MEEVMNMNFARVLTVISLAGSVGCGSGAAVSNHALQVSSHEIVLTDSDSEQLATTLISDIEAQKIKPINGHLIVDSIVCQNPAPEFAQCVFTVRGTKLPVVNGTDALALVALFDEIGAATEESAGVSGVDCTTLGVLRCRATVAATQVVSHEGEQCGGVVPNPKTCANGLICSDQLRHPVTSGPGICVKVAHEGEACGSDIIIRTQCAPGLTCVFPEGGPITEHQVGTCKVGCSSDSECGNGTLCCNTSGAFISRPLQCLRPIDGGCPLFP